MKANTQSQFGFFGDYKKEFGGSLIKNKRKEARPLSTKYAIHLVLKSEGNRIFNPTNTKLEKLIRDHAKKYGIKIYNLALTWTHIHFALKLPSRHAYKAFIRTVTARIVDHLTKQLGKNLKGLFTLRPYTRVLSSWKREFNALLKYVDLNFSEAMGFSAPRKRKMRSKNKASSDHIPTSCPKSVCE